MPTLKEIRAEYQAIARYRGSHSGRERRLLRGLAIKKLAELRVARQSPAKEGDKAMSNPRRDDRLQRPGYWMHESSGVLRPVIEAYLLGKQLSPIQIAGMRAYLRQWIMSPTWASNPHLVAEGRVGLADLRERIETLTDQQAIERWIDDAQHFGMDPL